MCEPVHHSKMLEVGLLNCMWDNNLQSNVVFYTTLTNFSTIYLVMCKVYTDVGGIILYHVCPPERKIIHSLKLVDYLHVQVDNPWYNLSTHMAVFL